MTEPQRTPSENILYHFERGTLVRNEWGDGRERACLLAAMWPDVAKREDASVCPATVMPQWLARMTPAMDDHGSIEAWPEMVRRYASLAGRWHVLDAAAWDRVHLATKLIVVRDAFQSAAKGADAAKRPEIAERLRSVVLVSAADLSAAQEVARTARAELRADAADAAAYAAADAADAAAYAAAAAADAAYAAADDAAADDAAADAAAYAAAAAAAAYAAAAAAAADAADARRKAREAAYDRMTSAIFDAIESEIVKVEAA